MTEAEFIAALRALPLHPGARGLADDCAVLEIGNETLVLTHDAMVQGTHFRADADLADVAWKLVASNLSDLAAKSAHPIGILHSHSLSAGDERFIKGLGEALTAFKTPLLGGDTVLAKGGLTFGMTAIGRASCAPVPSRCGAQIGDALYVSGILGRAMLGFEGVENHIVAFNRPNPRLEEGRALAPLVSAMMDVSDGLLLDAFRLAEASEITIAIESKKVPLAAPERAFDCMTWGDDYELLFTLPADTACPIEANQIGVIEPRGFAPLVLDGEPVVNPQGLGYSHS